MQKPAAFFIWAFRVWGFALRATTPQAGFKGSGFKDSCNPKLKLNSLYMKIHEFIVIFKLTLWSGGSGFQPRFWNSRNRANRGWKPLPQDY